MNPTSSNAASLDLALIGNCAISALVDRRGAVVWCCMPRFDGEPIFQSLLDGGRSNDEASVMAVELEGFARSEQSYDPGTAVLRTRLYDAAGEGIEIVEAFNVCSFRRIDALARVGRTERAREIFEALLVRRNHVGLLSEDLHVASGELWGNFPQTYSMVGIINGAVRLSTPWDALV